MLEIKNLSVKSGKKIILNDVTMTAKSGRITVILGKNGSGKTTLVRAVSGVCKYSGEIFLNGADLHTMNEKERAKKVSVMPQRIPTPDIQVWDFVAFGRTPYLGFGGILSDNDRTIIEKAMKDTDIIALKNEKVSRLSGGERQRAYLALLLAQNSDTVILDEPTANLDSEYRRMVFKTAQKMKNDGKTVVLILHHLSEAVRNADDICVIDNKECCFNADVNSFIESNVTQRIFGERAVKLKDDSGNIFTVFRHIN